jgi:hypothetical protein
MSDKPVDEADKLKPVKFYQKVWIPPIIDGVAEPIDDSGGIEFSHTYKRNPFKAML